MFRFAIRDVLWLTVVVALGVGWGTQQQTMKVEWARLQNSNYNLGVLVVIRERQLREFVPALPETDLDDYR